ncbi:alpha/beta fold hydrolase [Leifsonia aquatica]|uniref:alpha/beta fold hydrolase n=1 Tax=Leifsonia aquatica TaxID=144185 RepID=UPI0028AB86FF|nr:hypothetical protein [Leifsonia aquatica]
MNGVDGPGLIASSIPGAQLAIVPGATHGLVAERPELIATIVRAFLDDVRLAEAQASGRPSD